MSDITKTPVNHPVLLLVPVQYPGLFPGSRLGKRFEETVCICDAQVDIAFFYKILQKLYLFHVKITRDFSPE